MALTKASSSLSLSSSSSSSFSSSVVQASILDWKFPLCPSDLPRSLRRTIRKLFDIEMLRSSMCDSGLDLPLGRVTKDTISKACQCLGIIKGLLVQQQELTSSQSIVDTNAVRGLLEQIAKHSADFYELVPHQEGQSGPIRPLRTLQEVKLKSDMLRSLDNIQLGARVVLAASNRPFMNPLDYCYQSLGVRLEELSSRTGGDELNAVLQYVSASSNMQVETVYRLQREGEAERIQAWKGTSNRMLLWHGTKSANVVGILRQGLRVAPPEAPKTGYMFGKGIYFADSFDKSLAYCNMGYSQVGQSPRGFLFLSEVVLGKSFECRNANYMESAQPGTQSTKGVGRSGPHPSQTIVLQNGVAIPLGKSTTLKVPKKERFRWMRYSSPVEKKLHDAIEAAISEAKYVFPVQLTASSNGVLYTVTVTNNSNATMVQKAGGVGGMGRLFGTSARGIQIQRREVSVNSYYSLHRNEYIVYDESQVRLRYLVQVREDSGNQDSDSEDE